jgi:hypothetical protein
MAARALVAAAFGMVLLVASTSSAAIVPQQGIAGVRLAMSTAQVRSVLGRPRAVRRGTNEFGRFTELRYRRLAVVLQGGSSVTSIRTSRRSERTRSGVGVGSTEAQLRAGVPRLRCRTEFGTRHCFLGRFLPGRRVTDFTIRQGRAVRVVVGFVID